MHWETLKSKTRNSCLRRSGRFPGDRIVSLRTASSALQHWEWGPVREALRYLGKSIGEL